MRGIDEDDRVGFGSPGFTSIGLPLRCRIEGVPTSIMIVDLVVDCVEKSCFLGLREECSSVIEKRKRGT